MLDLIRQHQPELDAVCRHFDVRRLELFGSATSEHFDEQRSDLDFLVEFDPKSEIGPADRYFGLLEALQALFQRRVDLVEVKAIRNPYFLSGISASRTLLYVA